MTTALLENDRFVSPRAGFTEAPLLVIWETTRACALKCVHCRAEAVDRRSPDELTTSQAFALLDEIARFGKPLVVLTGGDPMRRPDLFEIVEHGAAAGLSVAVTPSATHEMTRHSVERLKQSGAARIAVSLDGPTAAIHDGFRQVPGSFGWTLDIARWAKECGLPVQINTTISRHNAAHVDAIIALLRQLDIVLWSVFFLVPTGRGKDQRGLSADEYEHVFERMADFSARAGFRIKSTEAPHYRRVLIQRRRRRAEVSCSDWPAAEVEPSPKAVNSGKGFVFVSHTGDIYPSGFLPVSAGNVKSDSLVGVYRHSDLFRTLRDPSRLKGKCGACEYKALCGGSRARAFAITGDYLAEEPCCAYVPAAFRGESGHVFP